MSTPNSNAPAPEPEAKRIAREMAELLWELPTRTAIINAPDPCERIAALLLPDLAKLVAERAAALASRDLLAKTLDTRAGHEAEAIQAAFAAGQADAARLCEELATAQRDAGLYAATLELSAKLLGCEPHMLNHAVERLLQAHAQAGAGTGAKGEGAS